MLSFRGVTQKDISVSSQIHGFRTFFFLSYYEESNIRCKKKNLTNKLQPQIGRSRKNIVVFVDNKD